MNTFLRHAAFPYIVIFLATLPLLSIMGWFQKGFLLSNHDNLHVLFAFYANFIDSLFETGSLDPWNEYVWGGMQSIGNPNMALNPLLYGLLWLGKANFFAALDVHLYLEILLGGWGIYVLAQYLINHRLVACGVALFYIFSTPLNTYISFYNLHFQFAVVPWITYLVLSHSRRRFRTQVVLLSLLIYMQVTTNMLQFTVYSFYFYVLFPLVFASKQNRYRQMMKPLFVSFVVAFFLGLHFEIPVVEFLGAYRDRQRFNWELYAERVSVAPYYLVNLLHPQFFHKNIQFWPKWNDGWSYLESCYVWAGTLPGLLFCYALICGVTLRKYVGEQYRVLFRLCLFSLVLLGLNFTKWGGLLLLALGGGTQVPFSRSTLFLIFPLLIIAGYLAKAFVNLTFPYKRFGVFCVGLGLLLMSLKIKTVLHAVVHSFFALAGMPSNAGEFLQSKEQLLQSSVNEVLIVFAVIVAFVLAIDLTKSRRVRQVLVGLLFLASFGELYHFITRWFLPTYNTPYPYKELFQTKNPLLDHLKKLPDTDEYLMFNGTVKRMHEIGITPSQHAINHLPMMNGYTSVVPRPSPVLPSMYRANFGGTTYTENLVKLQSLKYFIFSENPTRQKEHLSGKLKRQFVWKNFEVFTYEQALPRFYFPHKVEAVEHRHQIQHAVVQHSFDPQSVSYWKEAKPFSGSTGDCRPRSTIVERRGSAYVLEVENTCKHPVVFALNLPTHPWWKFYLNEKEYTPGRLNEIHHGIWIPRGIHRVLAQAEPRAWRLSLWISSLTFIGLLLWWWRGRQVRQVA